MDKRPIIVYYHITTDDGTVCMTTTEKEYWDTMHAVDDGEGRHHDGLCDAMEACGYERLSTSEYMLADEDDEPITERDVIANLRRHGFDLRRNEGFSAFLEHLSDRT